MAELKEKLLKKLDERIEKKDLAKYVVEGKTIWALPIEKVEAWKQDLVDIITEF